ncbi:MAG: hypothetical protein U9R74_09055 [Pseudomonadota bacterium]|nr:hypothetical protein [Pseudomonadota bacterium]
MKSRESAFRVECYAGYRGEETPRRLYLGGRRTDVLNVIDRWLSPDHRYFKVRGDDGGVYIICHDVTSGEWEMHLFDSGRHPETRLSST